jgi:NFU1 iron-sulfur cluster scaffold homolog, mitochondrial
MLNYDVLVRTQSTPNPLAIKFIVNAPIKVEGKATFTNKEEAEKLSLSRSLFEVNGVEQLHFFENVITVTHTSDVDRDKLIEEVTSVIQTRLPNHDAHFVLENEKKQKLARQTRTPEIDQIEEILDRTIRPGLQADGGDIEIVDFKDNVVTVSYEGACGSCPSSMYGTLDAIHSILRAEYDPNIDIMIA